MPLCPLLGLGCRTPAPVAPALIRVGGQGRRADAFGENAGTLLTPRELRINSNTTKTYESVFIPCRVRAGPFERAALTRLVPGDTLTG